MLPEFDVKRRKLKKVMHASRLAALRSVRRSSTVPPDLNVVGFHLAGVSNSGSTTSSPVGPIGPSFA